MAENPAGLAAMPYRAKGTSMGSQPHRGGWKRHVFGVATRWATYARIFYLLLSFPVAVASWVTLVTLVAVGGGLAVTVVGIPMLVLVMFGWCYYADLERLLSNVLLRTEIRPLPFAQERSERWILPRVRARLANRYTWRAFAYLAAVRFALGIAGFVVVMASLGFALQLVLAPLAVALDSGGIQLFNWTIDSGTEALACVPIGLALILPALHVSNLAGLLTGRVNTAFLQSRGDAGTPDVTALDRAARAALRWPGMLAREGAGESQRERSIQVRAWVVHFALYAAVMVFLLFINGMYSPGTWWVLWPVWAWGIALALHTGYLLGGHLGGHACAFAAANVGLFVIDSTYAGSTWFYWPLIAWAIALAAHAYVYFGFSRVEPAPLVLNPFALGMPGGALDAAPAATAPETGIAVDREMRQVRAAGEPVEVTPREFDLLVLMTGQPGRPFSRDELLEQIWKDDYEVTDRTIDTHVQRLRKKLGAAAECIQTVWGIGYRYQP